MTRILDAEVAVAAQCELAEGPVWDASRGLLWWVDILVGHVHTVDPVSGARTRFDAGDPVGAVGLTRSGGLVLALVDGFALADHDGQRLTRVPEFQHRPGHGPVQRRQTRPVGELLGRHDGVGRDR